MPVAEIVIVGGGFIGMAAAAALAGAGRRVLVLEARAGANPQFRGELIHPHGVGVLATLGLHGPLVSAGARSVDGFAVVPGIGKDPVVLPYDEVDGVPGRGLSMDHNCMVNCLRREVSGRPGVELRTDRRVAGLLRDGDRIVGVTTADRQKIFGDLIVVAEGRHSKLRSLLGVGEEIRLLSFTAALLLGGVDVPHARHGHVFLGGPGPVLAYGIGSGRVRMCVDIPIGVEKGRAEAARLLRETYAPFVTEPLRTAMLRAEVGATIELCANHAIRTLRCAAPGVALVGDSGGCCHPLTATGLTTGLNDIRLLAEEIAGPGPLNEALERYQRRRYRFVRARELVADSLYDIFRGAEDGSRAIRNGMFRYWRASARSRRASMALLSGRDSSIAAVVREYSLVVGQSAYGLLHGDLCEPSLRRRAASMTGLIRTSYEKVEKSVATMYEDLTR